VLAKLSLKPEPGWMLLKVYDPSLFVVVVTSNAVFVSVSVTCTPGINAPPESVTVPVTPDVAWANTNDVENNSVRTAVKSVFIFYSY
jgi:hypothetical protein